MFIKIISLTISYSLLLFLNNSFKPTYAADCEAHLSRPGANRAKEMAKKKRTINNEKNLGQLNKKK